MSDLYGRQKKWWSSLALLLLGTERRKAAWVFLSAIAVLLLLLTPVLITKLGRPWRRGSAYDQDLTAQQVREALEDIRRRALIERIAEKQRQGEKMPGDSYARAPGDSLDYLIGDSSLALTPEEIARAVQAMKGKDGENVSITIEEMEKYAVGKGSGGFSGGADSLAMLRASNELFGDKVRGLGGSGLAGGAPVSLQDLKKAVASGKLDPMAAELIKNKLVQGKASSATDQNSLLQLLLNKLYGNKAREMVRIEDTARNLASAGFDAENPARGFIAGAAARATIPGTNLAPAIRESQNLAGNAVQSSKAAACSNPKNTRIDEINRRGEELGCTDCQGGCGSSCAECDELGREKERLMDEVDQCS